MNTREQDIAEARRLISDRRLIAFFRAIGHRAGPLAAELIGQKLDNGKTPDEIFYTGDEYGYSLHVECRSDAAFYICFGCQAGHLAGDGGHWEVIFDGDEVKSADGGMSWIS